MDDALETLPISLPKGMDSSCAGGARVSSYATGHVVRLGYNVCSVGESKASRS